jgi:ubiquinone/menaquinone biosynthesis C-methylase UbiE
MHAGVVGAGWGHGVSQSHNILNEEHVCPWWFVYSFDNPVRRLFHDPTRILADLVRPGDRCLDVGCGIGYFTIPMARLAGPDGSVVAVDMQPQMLAGVGRRAARARVADRIELHRAEASALGLSGAFDCALLFWMVHEVPDQGALFRQVYTALKPGGRLLLVEPRGHVPDAAFEHSVAVAQDAGFRVSGPVPVRFSQALLFDAGKSEV